MERSELVAGVRDYALKNYNKDGWDILVECWEDDDILAALGDVQTKGAAILRIRQQLRLVNERWNEVHGEVF